MPFASANGQSFYYEVTGDGPPVLFSHGFLMDHTMWDPQVAALSDEFTCITWDERGFGTTEFQPEPFTMWDAADDAVSILDFLGIEKATLVGMSQGGYLTMRAAIRHPDRVKAVVLVDTKGDGLSSEEYKGYFEFFDSWAESGPTDEHINAMADAILGTDWLVREWAPRWRAVDKGNVRWTFPASLPEESVLPQLAGYLGPLTVIHGSADTSFPVSDAEDINAAAGNGLGVHVIEGGTHAANLTHPDETNKVLREFLKKYA
jgi:3-oxoadipate enol-lactonase